MNTKAPGQAPLLEVNQLSADYGSGAVIRTVFLRLDRPAFLAVTGHNGSGKTTLFKALTGILPFTGRAAVNGISLQAPESVNTPALIAGLPQKSAVSFSVSVLELVVTGRFRQKKLFENYSPADYAAARKALADLNIARLADSDFTRLSGGQQQLVWLAQLELQDAPVLFLDEPTQHLDLYNRRLIFEQMQRWVKQGKAVICITHDIPYLEKTEGYLLHLENGTGTAEPISPALLETVREKLESRE